MRIPSAAARGWYLSFTIRKVVAFVQKLRRMPQDTPAEAGKGYGRENFELDHFFPVSKFPLKELDFYNLYYACHPCNNIKRAQWPDDQLTKQGIGFVDLCTDDFATHFRELPDGSWEGLTPSARYTIEALRLNRHHLQEIRLLLRKLQ